MSAQAQRNPFEQAAQASYTGRFASGTTTLRLKPEDAGFAGTLQFQGNSYTVQAQLKQGQLQGTFKDASGSWPFSAVREGQNLQFTAGQHTEALARVPLPKLEGEYQGDSVWMKIAAEGAGYGGTVKVQGKEMPLSARETADELTGTVGEGTNAISFTLAVDKNALVFRTGSFRDVLRRMAHTDTGGLPAEVVLDQHLAEARRLYEKEEWTAASAGYEKAFALNFPPPPEAHYEYALCLYNDSARCDPTPVMKALKEYLKAGDRTAAHYQDGLSLLGRVQDDLSIWSQAQQFARVNKAVGAQISGRKLGGMVLFGTGANDPWKGYELSSDSCDRIVLSKTDYTSEEKIRWTTLRIYASQIAAVEVNSEIKKRYYAGTIDGSYTETRVVVLTFKEAVRAEITQKHGTTPSFEKYSGFHMALECGGWRSTTGSERKVQEDFDKVIDALRQAIAVTKAIDGNRSTDGENRKLGM